MLVSLIITTYNWKEALRLSLESVLTQTALPHEIIVADDGSGADTAAVIAAVSRQASVPVIHSWQEDKGFRLAMSRNKAIARTTGDYVILIDGDILLEPHFIADHLSAARPGFFVQGTRVLLGRELSVRVLAEGRLRVPRWGSGLENRKNCLRSMLLSRLFSWTSRRLPGIKTCNFAFWKADAVKVNGFNEEFEGWGREDSEFTARLFNSGVRRKNIRFHALGYHLFHPMNTRERLGVNDAILRRTIEEKRSWCDKGLDQYLEKKPAFID
jgi:glycosyltransferase involved in cell wall biosynthesis